MAVPAAGAPRPPAPQYSHREVLGMLSGALLGLLLAALDQTIVVTALPSIAADFNGLEHLAWIVTAYLLTSTASTPIYGKLSDLYGRRRLIQIAIVLFVAASAFCALAQGMGQLIAARAARHWRRRPHQPVAGDHRRHHRAARTRPLSGLYERRLGRGQRRRPGRRRAVRPVPDLALGVLAQSADRSPRLGARPPRLEAFAGAPRAGPHRLSRRREQQAEQRGVAARLQLGRRGILLALPRNSRSRGRRPSHGRSLRAAGDARAGAVAAAASLPESRDIGRQYHRLRGFGRHVRRDRAAADLPAARSRD